MRFLVFSLNAASVAAALFEGKLRWPGLIGDSPCEGLARAEWSLHHDHLSLEIEERKKKKK